MQEQDEPGSEQEAADESLLSRLRLIEDQPLESRAAAYAGLHDELRKELEGRSASEGA